MAHYRMTEEAGSAVSIELTEVADRQDTLLGAFASCQAGQCSCPTDEYEKLDSMHIETNGHQIRLRLEPIEGQKFDLSEIANCLEHTTSRATDPER